MTSVAPCPLPAPSTPVLPVAAPGSGSPGLPTSAEEFASRIGQALEALDSPAGMALTGDSHSQEVGSGPAPDPAPDPAPEAAPDAASRESLGDADLVAAFFPRVVAVDPAGAWSVPTALGARPGAGVLDGVQAPVDPGQATATPSPPTLGDAALLRPEPATTAPARGQRPTGTGDSVAPDTTSPTAALPSVPTPPTGAASAAPPGAVAGSPLGAVDSGPASTPTPGASVAVGAPTAPAVTAAPAAPAAPPAAPVPVAAQVVTALTDLVQRGDGSHRITLELAPAALGEVRVVMTVRAGVVHVQLAAGETARQALREGSPELTRMLEQIGATEARVVLRELAPASVAGTAGRPDQAGADPHSGQPQTGQHPSGQHQTGQPQSGDPHSSHAGTRASTPARDGPDQLHPRSEPNDPVARPRPAGVDVTM